MHLQMNKPRYNENSIFKVSAVIAIFIIFFSNLHLSVSWRSSVNKPIWIINVVLISTVVFHLNCISKLTAKSLARCAMIFVSVLFFLFFERTKWWIEVARKAKWEVIRRRHREQLISFEMREISDSLLLSTNDGLAITHNALWFRTH